MAGRASGIKGTEGDVIGHRIGAIIIDWIILGVVSLLILGATFLSTFTAGTLATGSAATGGILSMFSFFFSLLAVVVIAFLYGFILEGWRGQTVGKMALGIIVVKEDGRPCDYVSSFVRNILRVVDGIFAYVVGLIVIVLTKRRQRIGDIVAKTVVVRAKK